MFCKAETYQRKRSAPLIVTAPKTVPQRLNTVLSAQQRLAVHQ